MMAAEPGEAQPVTRIDVIVNWFEDLRRRASAGQ